MKQSIATFVQNTSSNPRVTEKIRSDKLLLTATETAHLLSLAPRTVYALVEAGQLPCVRIGRSVRIPRKAVLALAGEA